MPGLDTLIKAMNKLQDAFAVLGQSPLDLPQIAVVGGQSAGKSSVLENIVGKDFLPRGSGIVTRRPLVLKLITETRLEVEYAEFLHLPGQKFTDWSKVREAIESATEKDPKCANKGISKVPINLTIFSPNVLNLTLIDLPGMTRVAVGDQPPDINEQIRDMLMHFISNPRTLILAVTPANQDLANSDAMQLAREVDPQGNRTVGVLTKLDLMDRGTDALSILNNEVIPLKLGYIPVVNRSQHDINTGTGLENQWSAEEKYFKEHPRYGGIADRCGTKFLTKSLNTFLALSIRDHLPDIVLKINKFMDDKKDELGDLKEIGDPAKRAQTVLNSTIEYAEKFRQMMEGRDDDADMNQISGGAKIASLFRGKFVNELNKIDVLESLSPSQLRNIIRNASGLSGGLFIPDEAFQVVIRRAAKKLEHPSLHCVQLVYDELMRQALSIVTPAMSRYSQLGRKMHTVARETIAARMLETKSLVQTLIEMEQALVNTHHPDFTSNLNMKDMLSDSNNNSSTNVSSDSGKETKTTDAATASLNTTQLLIEGWLELQKTGVMGKRWSKKWVEIKNRTLIYSSKTEHAHHKSHSSMTSISGVDDVVNPLMNASSQSNEKEKTISLDGGSVELLDDGVSFLITPSIGKQITLRCSNKDESNKWVHSITVALSKETWNAYVTGQKRTSTRMRSPSAHAMVSARKGKVISQGSRRGARRASASMTDNDIVQAQVIEHLLDSYFDIILKKIQDSVPKAITLKLVNEVKKVLQTELVTQLYGNEEQINKLMAESEGAQEKRDKLVEVLALMEEAMSAVNEVRSEI